MVVGKDIYSYFFLEKAIFATKLQKFNLYLCGRILIQ